MFLFRFVFIVVWHTVEAVPDIQPGGMGIQLTICDDGIAIRRKTDGSLPAALDDLDGSGLGIQMADGFACAISDDFFSDHFIHLACFWYVCEASLLNIADWGALSSRKATRKPHALHADVMAFAVKKKHPHKSLLARRFWRDANRFL